MLTSLFWTVTVSLTTSMKRCHKQKLEVVYITVSMQAKPTSVILCIICYQKMLQFQMKLFVEMNFSEMVHSVVSVKMDITLLFIPSI